MSIGTSVESGVDGFVSGLARCGLEARVDHGVVMFSIMATVGPLAGKLVSSGVAVSELAGWPACPPHWVHFLPDVTFVRTNSQGSTVPGWLKHSRNANNWGNAGEPAQAWIGHVRAILASAQ